MILFGDLGVTGILNDTYDLTVARLREVLHLFEGDDMVVCNLECPIDNGPPYNANKNFVHLSSRNATIAYLKALNIDCVAIANNHIN